MSRDEGNWFVHRVVALSITYLPDDERPPKPGG